MTHTHVCKGRFRAPDARRRVARLKPELVAQWIGIGTQGDRRTPESWTNAVRLTSKRQISGLSDDNYAYLSHYTWHYNRNSVRR